ncbi:hypothetical protein DYB37_009712 [Aphanomyces astaci]|uniref:Uncharacterized protein n=1 Tax=Aphanomyces astaci TaxID=112090 RepID=A0A418EYQ7_APHAT|nr:hypothetical protein DYB37_009712 [Aphanomyces astaci]
MLETFKSTDRAQRLWGTGSEEEVTEEVQLLQNLVDRREAKDEAKKAKKEKDQKRRDAMELTGLQLCLEAEQRVAKRYCTAGTAQKKEESDSALQDLLDFEKQKHSDDHTNRLERLEFGKEEKKIRLAQMSESAKCNDKPERLLIEMGKKSEPDKFGFGSGKKKLKTESGGKRSFGVGESLMQGLKAQAQVQADLSREVLASRAAELQLRKENEDRHFMLRMREIDLKAKELRHKQIIEEARLMSSMSFDKADVME